MGTCFGANGESELFTGGQRNEEKAQMDEIREPGLKRIGDATAPLCCEKQFPPYCRCKPERRDQARRADDDVEVVADENFRIGFNPFFCKKDQLERRATHRIS